MKIALHSIVTKQKYCVGYSKATKSFAEALLMQVIQTIVRVINHI